MAEKNRKDAIARGMKGYDFLASVTALKNSVMTSGASRGKTMFIKGTDFSWGGYIEYNQDDTAG